MQVICFTRIVRSYQDFLPPLTKKFEREHALIFQAWMFLLLSFICLTWYLQDPDIVLIAF